MPVVSATWEDHGLRLVWTEVQDLSEKPTKSKKTGGVPQVVKRFECEALSTARRGGIEIEAQEESINKTVVSECKAINTNVLYSSVHKVNLNMTFFVILVLPIDFNSTCNSRQL
jgi:hypothetical protein